MRLFYFLGYHTSGGPDLVCATRALEFLSLVGPKQIEGIIIDNQLETFLETGVSGKEFHSEKEYISNIFMRSKKDGSYRVILKLKYLNEFVEYHHLKMENLKSAIICMSRNCYMASIDLKDAYYSLSIDPNHRKYLQFKWKNQLFQFTCLSNGLRSAPRIFTKLLF